MLNQLFPMQKLRKRKTVKKAAVVCFLAVFLLVILPQLGLAQDQFGLETAAKVGLPQVDLKVAIARVIQIILGFLGLMAVAIILYGGYVYMTAAGDPSKVEKAKKILRDAIIGLIIILAAFTIVSFIIRALTGGWFGPPTGPRPGGPADLGRWGIGRGPIESVYPEPGQREVPINTYIAVTFKENVKPETICETLVDGRCQGSKMKNVEICKLDNESNCETTGDFTIDSFKDSTAMNRAGDSRTFVFTPNKYLGLEDFQDREFKATLKSGILKASDGKPILDKLFNKQYYWSFMTNGELDLDPPEIVSTNVILNPSGVADVSGVYPNPDNLADSYSVSSQPTPTTFDFSVANFAGVKSEVATSKTQPVVAIGSGFPQAALSGIYGGTGSGPVTVTVYNGGQKARTDWPDPMTDADTNYNGGNTIDIGPYGLTFTLAGRAVDGNNWTFNVTAYQPGDKIEILRSNALIKTYIIGRDISKGNIGTDLINNIKNKILEDSGVIFESCGTSCIRTKETGGDSARYNIRSVKYNSSPPETVISSDLAVAKTNGADSSRNQAVRSQRDVPKNTIFQINFNEAINPIFVDKVAVKYDRDGNGAVDTIVSGVQIEISNQYRTVEFKGPSECGVNSCGNKIYCWPINDLIAANPDDLNHRATEYEVAVEAASLMPPADGRCAQWGGQSEPAGRCRKIIGGQTVYYPTAKTPFDGLLDMAANSFNGSFNYYEAGGKVNGISEGKTGICAGCSGTNNPYHLNASNPLYHPTNASGDNFKWSFFVSDKIDKQAPLVKKIDAGNLNRKGDQETIDLSAPVDLSFDRMMRSATLKPGWNYGDTKKDRSVRHLILETIGKANPVGYWVGKDNLDGDGDIFPDYTRAEINHNLFSVNVRYSPLAGSGIESITQNCFLPSAGPADAGSGNCVYTGETATAGCANVALPNPASYGKLNCLEITDAKVCGNDQACKVLYYESGKPETDLGGSWILTKDYSRGSDNDNANGCCLGVCVDK